MTTNPTTPNPTTKPARPEKLIMAKELKFWFEDHHGIIANVRYWRLLIRECGLSYRDQYIRASDAARWYFDPANDGWKPYNRKRVGLEREARRRAALAALPAPSHATGFPCP
jgi:hypothetical protein